MRYNQIFTTYGYGANSRSIGVTWVAENAIEQFKNETINHIKNVMHWKDSINFDTGLTLDEHHIPIGGLQVYTLNGYTKVYKH